MKLGMRSNTVIRVIVACVAPLVVGCGGVIEFQGQNALAIQGEPPPPPPPPPPPEPPKPPEPPPRVELRDNKIEIHEKIQFEVNKATILEASFGLLDEIVSVIKKNPQIKKIAIEGHASAEGDAQKNLKLSDDRAKAVMKYLVDHGIAKERLTSKGFGATKPIASNDTEEGREQNRRVEFNIVEQDVSQKKVEIDPKTGKERVVEEKTITEKKPEATAPPAESAKAAPAEAKKPGSVPAKPAATKPEAAKKAPPKPAALKTPAKKP